MPFNLEHLTNLFNLTSGTADPFSLDFLESISDLMIEENERNSEELQAPTQRRQPRARRVVSPKFYLSKPLKNRLQKLIKTTENEEIKQIATELLEKKRQEDSLVNYLGLSQDDFSKISYLDRDRIQKYKDETYTRTFIGSGTKCIIKKVVRIYNRTSNEVRNEVRPIELVFTKSHFPNELPCEVIDGEIYLKSDQLVDIYSRKLCARIKNNLNIEQGTNKLSVSHYFLSEGYEIIPTTIVESKLWNPNIRYHSSVGKVLRKVFGNKYTDNAICKFAEEYYKLVVVDGGNYDFVLASGEDIRKYYLDANYLSENRSQLWNSCMRYSHCQKYFGLYESNPNCKLSVLLHKDKVAARALVWTDAEGKKYYDRIYAYNQKTYAVLEAQLTSLNYLDMRKNHHGYVDGVMVQIPAPNVEELVDDNEKFPYVDTLKYFNRNTGMLCASVDENYYYFSRTSGDYEASRTDRISCNSCHNVVDVEDIVTAEGHRYHGEHICQECSVWVDNRQMYVHYDDAVEDYYGDMILSSESVELVDGSYVSEDCDYLASYENNYGYFITDGEFDYEEIDGLYYHLDDPNKPVEEQEQQEEQQEQINQIEAINEQSTNNPINNLNPTIYTIL